MKTPAFSFSGIEWSNLPIINKMQNTIKYTMTWKKIKGEKNHEAIHSY